MARTGALDDARRPWPPTSSARTQSRRRTACSWSRSAGDRAGTVSWERVNRRSRIAAVSAFVIDPARRGERVGVPAARAIQRHLIRDIGFHRLQMEVYAFNERALRHAERAGWIREGVRRKAYLRDGVWVDGIMFGLVEEDLDEPGAAGSPG